MGQHIEKTIIDQIREQIDMADFPSAVTLIENNQYTNIFPLTLYKCLYDLLNFKDNGSIQWFEYFSDLSVANKAEILFSTFNKEKGFDFTLLENFFNKQGEGLLRIKTFLEMVTLGDKSCVLNHNKLSEEKLYVIHFLASFPSNINDNFYLSLINDDYDESIRFSNEYLAVCNDASIVSCNNMVPKLYTVTFYENILSLYVNGILEKRKKRSRPLKFKTLELKLIGSSGADLGGIIHGLEIWQLDQPFQGFNTNNDILFIKRIEGKIKEEKLSDIYDLLESIDDLELKGISGDIIQLLDNQLTKPGYQEWLIEGLLKHLPKEKAEKWLTENNLKIPVPAIDVKDLSIEFFKNPYERFSLSRIIKRKKAQKFDVLKNINFKVYPGDIIGIIGENGAGKSTLLRTIAGLVPIDQGRILLKGSHLLLSPGLGIRDQLTGKENIFLAGFFMGLGKKQINKLYNEIVEFSELNEFIDQPFKFYSDGMKSRLIFSIATSISPEILMLDELLGAGDVKFQQKALTKMDELIDKSKIVVIVTHSLPFVEQKCNKALLLSKGEQIYYGSPATAITYYLNRLHLGIDKIESETNSLNYRHATEQQPSF